jgi:NADPH-ferrihemoprotein reductase
MVANLDDFNCDDLSCLPSGKVAIFLVATYGEGEATDNAIAFEKYLASQTTKAAAADYRPESTLRYAAFGLGNSSY